MLKYQLEFGNLILNLSQLIQMSTKTHQLLQKKKKNILELWMKNQLADEGLREDLISNDELRSQSEELINALVNNLTEENFSDLESEKWSPVIEILGGIAITRAR